jgi:hypothetical protein
MKNERTGCPDHERLLRIFLADPRERDKEGLADHLLDCPRCRLKLSLLVSVQRERSRRESGLEDVELTAEEIRAFRKIARSRLHELEGEKGRRPRPIRRLRAMPIWAAAAGLLIIAAGGFLALRQFTRGPEAYRSTAGAVLLLREPLGRLKEAPAEFTWAPIQGGEDYHLKLMDPGLHTVFETGVPYPPIRLTEEIRGRLVRGITYLWTIVARGDIGEVLARGQGTFVIE